MVGRTCYAEICRYEVVITSSEVQECEERAAGVASRCDTGGGRWDTPSQRMREQSHPIHRLTQTGFTTYPVATCLGVFLYYSTIPTIPNCTNKLFATPERNTLIK